MRLHHRDRRAEDTGPVLSESAGPMPRPRSLPKNTTVERYLGICETMATPAAIIVGAMLVAGVILLTNHYDVTHARDGSENVIRLNRWTGEIDMCAKDDKAISAGTAAGMNCEHR
jgi:hypothetical protein